MKVYQVFISERAERNLEHILQYLEEEWSIKVKKEFLEELNTNFDRISVMPFLFPKSDKFENLHKGLITKHAHIFYQVFEDYIDIVTIQDTRQNPDFLK
ncbi:type II toxin-antitoxin system RelE/ParE family toxin [Arcicella sp. LKC2W]|nr:type II toxin-antitoxin system RelE/ParE family toxin [Arcicella sp. LKC2W]MEA5458236.1 type II toxin-antitoxin system RelE/ParE family toxin [Arcicella sp. LKC2W]